MRSRDWKLLDSFPFAAATVSLGFMGLCEYWALPNDEIEAAGGHGLSSMTITIYNFCSCS